MSWVAYYQADGEMRYTIAIKRHEHQAEYEREKFVARMTHPDAVLWWAWIEEITDDGTVHQD